MDASEASGRGRVGNLEAPLCLSFIPERLIHRKAAEGGGKVPTGSFLTLKLASRAETLLVYGAEMFRFERVSCFLLDALLGPFGRTNHGYPESLQDCFPCLTLIEHNCQRKTRVGGGGSSTPPHSVAKRGPPLQRAATCISDAFVCFIFCICGVMREEKPPARLLNSSVMRRRSQSLNGESKSARTSRSFSPLPSF